MERVFSVCQQMMKEAPEGLNEEWNISKNLTRLRLHSNEKYNSAMEKMVPPHDSYRSVWKYLANLNDSFKRESKKELKKMTVFGTTTFV